MCDQLRGCHVILHLVKNSHGLWHVRQAHTPILESNDTRCGVTNPHSYRSLITGESGHPCTPLPPSGDTSLTTESEHPIPIPPCDPSLTGESEHPIPLPPYGDPSLTVESEQPIPLPPSDDTSLTLGESEHPFNHSVDIPLPFDSLSVSGDIDELIDSADLLSVIEEELTPTSFEILPKDIQLELDAEKAQRLQEQEDRRYAKVIYYEQPTISPAISYVNDNTSMFAYIDNILKKYESCCKPAGNELYDKIDEVMNLVLQLAPDQIDSVEERLNQLISTHSIIYNISQTLQEAKQKATIKNEITIEEDMISYEEEEEDDSQENDLAKEDFCYIDI
eukprot:TRINITY_DN5526_c0_g1_i1.p1 TRINITY_DN5526_c0_g1~~TRINITY_DN5526_c0_g1_i1.p1  ORF type:complete len:335 (-),score=76.19 TRINITY_DN5526_c0_g1_i1:83-1087(-)